MGKGKLGLPLEYKKFPQYFDAHNISEETASKNAVIEKLLKNQNVKTVLDLTCGTGSQVFYLAKRGYDVTGSDFSEGLIKIAYEKAKKENVKIKFFHGDMRTIKLGKYDAVITMFNAIGHVTKRGFNKAVKNIAHNLKPGGIYVFDIFNLQALTEEVVKDFSMDHIKEAEGIHIHNIQHSTINHTTGQLTSFDQHIITTPDGKTKYYKSKFSLQLYTVDELMRLLNNNGFDVIGTYGINGENFAKETTHNILMVGKKK
jgi:2-polyprenyl-3-methyl-5-hydroxy-6-metoxy-1,4-benzoquinol methylase